MAAEATEIVKLTQSIENLGIGGIALVVIYGAFKIIMVLLERKKDSQENQPRQDSRDKIIDTHKVVNSIEQRQKARDVTLFGIKEQTHDIHEVVTAKNNGQYILYNPELHDLMKESNQNMKSLTQAISNLSVRCNAIKQ